MAATRDSPTEMMMAAGDVSPAAPGRSQMVVMKMPQVRPAAVAAAHCLHRPRGSHGGGGRHRLARVAVARVVVV